jgi:outer membrane immunogenic protein
MKKLLLATVSAIALSSGTQAADLMPAYKAPGYPAAALPAWAGGYIGIQGGVARHDATFHEFHDTGRDTSLVDTKTGGTVGGVLGYNFQHGSFVYGVEGDWNWLGVKASDDALPGFFGKTSSFDVSWLATVRGRAGLAVDATLFYITGGVAFGKVKNDFAIVLFDGTPDRSYTQDDTKVGWTAGAGVEHLLSANWTVRAEFRFVDLGTTKVACTPSATNDCFGYRGQFSNKLMMGLVGLNYKF